MQKRTSAGTRHHELNSMHELSIAQNIVEIVTAQAENRKAGRILEVVVDIGTASGVVPDSLQFVWEMAVKDTLAEGARLKINVIEPKAVCNDCHQDFSIGSSYTCPQCGSSDYEIVLGRELKVVSIIIE